jgi:hypothetical protein
MADVVQALTQNGVLVWTWRAVVWACVAYLFALGVLAFVRPAIIHRFFDGFVASNGINFLEATLRLIAGLAFIAVSPETKLPLTFFWFGAALTATAIPMMFLYDFRKRQSVWAIPFSKRILPVMGVCAIALGALVVWALN